jgi:hypothetical protein
LWNNNIFYVNCIYNYNLFPQYLHECFGFNDVLLYGIGILEYIMIGLLSVLIVLIYCSNRKSFLIPCIYFPYFYFYIYPYFYSYLIFND